MPTQEVVDFSQDEEQPDYEPVLQQTAPSQKKKKMNTKVKVNANENPSESESDFKPMQFSAGLLAGFCFGFLGLFGLLCFWERRESFCFGWGVGFAILVLIIISLSIVVTS